MSHWVPYCCVGDFHRNSLLGGRQFEYGLGDYKGFVCVFTKFIIYFPYSFCGLHPHFPTKSPQAPFPTLALKTHVMASKCCFFICWITGLESLYNLSMLSPLPVFLNYSCAMLPSVGITFNWIKIA